MKRIIMAGKGGAGKTTVSAAILSKLLSDEKHLKIYVLDADPASTLAQKLGWNDKIPSKGIGELKTEIAESDIALQDSSVTKTKYVFEKVMKDAVTKAEKNGNHVAFSYMGHHEENSCLCAFNTAVNTVLMQLYNSPNFDYIFVDREAGLEHINRSVYGEKNDILMVVTWPSKEYIHVAKEILTLSDTLGTTKNRVIVMNSMFRENLTQEEGIALLEAQGIVNVPTFVFPFSPSYMAEQDDIEALIKDEKISKSLEKIIGYIKSL